MREHTFFFIIFLFAIIFISNKSSSFSKTIDEPEIQYLSPLPGSKYVTKETNIIVRFKHDLNMTNLNNLDFRIEGSASGLHSYSIARTEEKNTLLLKPVYYFSEREQITVTLPKQLFKTRKESYTFSFNISENRSNIRIQHNAPYSEEFNKYSLETGDYSLFHTPSIYSESLPIDFPEITILTKDDPNQGYIFLCNFAKFSPGLNIPYLIVLDNKGFPILYKRMNISCLDFKVQNNNTFTYFVGGGIEKFYSTTPSFTIKDSFYCGNGYTTDTHELLLFPNNHAYMMSYDTQTVDMSLVIPGGKPNARVVGLVIQEIDGNKNVIFQWRSWDHFQITDATHEDLLADYIDYVHGNAIDIDYDGNVLISSRHLDEITKIDRQTGQIIWRLGGKNNQFNFTNDTLKFSHQHCIRHLENGHYLLFDNGNYHSPPFSRVCEYDLDTDNMTATLVWEYRNSPDIYAFAMGSSQRLSDNNTVIGWGSANPTMTEVRPNGTKTFEMTFAPSVVSYRAFRHTWNGAPAQIPVSHSLGQNYPNPFNPLTSIDYELSQNSSVILKIYDLLGREVKTLVNDNQDAGRYSVSFNAYNLASGVYFYKLVANDFTDSKKMILVK